MNDHPIWHGWLAILAATNLLYHFPLLMVIISSIARRPDLGGFLVDRAQFRALLVDPGVVSRVTHSWLAAVAVAGMALTACGMCAGADATDGAGSRRVLTWGARIALVATLLQFGVGLWVLLLLPPPWRGALMGGSAVGCALLIAGLVTTVALMHHLIAVALGNTARRVVVRCMLLMLLVVVLMVGTLRKASGISAVGDTGRPTIGKGTHHATRGACSQRQSGDGENPARIRIQPLQLPVPA